MCYESAIEKQRYTNKKLNHEDKCMPKPVTIKPIEKDAATVYTRAIFYKVQDEIKYSVNMELDTCTVVDGVKKFMIKDFFVKDKLFEVDVILDTHNVTCSCKMFTRIGYPCRHAFYCLSACGIHKIPRDLLSKRWMKNAEKMHSTLDLGENSKSGSKEGKVKAKSQDVWFEFQGCLTDVSGDEDLLEYVLLELKFLRGKIQEKSKKKPTNSKSDVAERLIGVKPADVITVHPPHQSNNKGSRKRMLSSLEKSLDRRKIPTRICKICGVPALHDSRNCPLKVDEVIEDTTGEKENA
ncbi:hypothetical protein POM88_024574 [Heracleum sosnowskyi]|uniref:Protein FAR1-RELATED SEQUENCE n=1 Tax=Heracleum sosnowskyi TaxID=360622 RepID=A0AAD8I5D6_9APIA|nr:hypothetical protein POM88_024574 [Heracleum sosnowskyi]